MTDIDYDWPEEIEPEEDLTNLFSKDKRRLSLEEDLELEYGKADRVADSLGSKWTKEARCAELCETGEMDYDDWFAPSWTQPAARATDVCFNECPIRLLCLKAATTAKEGDGIFGGLNEGIRTGRNQAPAYASLAHDYDRLATMGNPYETDRKTNRWHRSRLKPWTKEDAEALEKKKDAAEVLCSFEGCERKAQSYGLCVAHYMQKSKGKELVPLKERQVRPRA
ncbi:WhiB family transcriptional regulator [Streptomyces sp. NPDC057307]|uniref:WhiB family transcriptional regulator n=1 Tax=Streptomyces sp. NPDC057307 TaxID=3346096 RepID=UPI003636742A